MGLHASVSLHGKSDGYQAAHAEPGQTTLTFLLGMVFAKAAKSD